MGQRVPGRNSYAPQYSRVFSTTQTDLTSFVVSAPAAGQQQVAPYQCAASGAVLYVTNATNTFAFTNCAGETVTLPANLAVGEYAVPTGMIAISAITGASALVYWHGSTLP